MSDGQRTATGLAALDAVTIDANGTIVEMRDPVPRLTELLRERGLSPSSHQLRAALEAEFAYYRRNMTDGRDRESLRSLRRECAQVFLDVAGANLDPDEFAPHYVEALEFRAIPGVVAALAALRARGLALAVVSNWDISLHERLEQLGLRPYFDAVVSSAEAGAGKPDPRIFEAALAQLGVQPERALHVGDSSEDAAGAKAAGLAFAEAPLQRLLRG
jgi:putative hydrolase of the HAD superfamily